jgi:hypothetical protein
MANKKISELPYLGSTGYTSSDIMPIVTYFSSVTGDTVHTPIIDFASYVLSATPINYSSLVTLISNSGLTQGSFYSIDDFQTCYDQPDFDYDGNPITTGNYKQGPVEPIIVLSTSNSTISPVAYQPTYPNDFIKYDITYNITEVTSGDAFGRIVERIDEFNNRTDYDHRNILFKRYKLFTYREELRLNGTVEIFGDGTVTGDSTSFTSLTVGDVIYTNNITPSYFEIVSITGNTLMTVSGDTINTTGAGAVIYGTVEETNGNGYFSYKRTNVKTSDFIEYTTFGDAIVNDYAKNNYIGNHANNYQNQGNGFLLSNNVFLEGQYESNKFGDYCYNNTWGTDNQNNIWGDFCYNNVSTNDIDRCTFGNYFRNNLINVNLNRNQIGNAFQNNKLLNENNSDFGNNVIANGFDNNTIYSQFYDNTINVDFNNNIIGDYNNLDNFQFYRNQIGNNFSKNTIRQNFQNNNVKTNYQGNTINGEFIGNTILNGFNNNNTGAYFSVNLIGNGFNRNTINDGFYSNETKYYFNQNKISNEFFSNKIGLYFQNNEPINTLFGWDNLSNITGRTYDNFNDSLIGNIDYRILGKPLVMKVTSTSQYFKIKFNQWTIDGYGGGFEYERTEMDSLGNDIGPTVTFTKRNNVNDIDIIIPGVLEIARDFNGGIYNIATEVSWNSSVSPQDTEWNSVYTEPNNGVRFANNKIGDYFRNNKIDNDFGYGGSQEEGNIINDNFQDNTIGKFMYNNVIGNYFTNNLVGDNFENNNIKNFFVNNEIGNSFEGNVIGDYFGNLGKRFSNTIGNVFINNVIGNNFGLDTNGDGGNKIGAVTTVYYNKLQGPVLGITLTSGGTGYSDSTNVPTTGGLGSSLTVDIFTDGLGVITGVTVNTPGTYYQLNDIITITTGGNDATFNVTGVTSFQVGDVVDNGVGGTAEVVTDDGFSAMTVNLYIGGFSNGDTIDNGVDTLASVTSVEVTLGDAFFKDNHIGNHFINNNIGSGFTNNQIGNYFGSLFTTGISNYILNDFSSNIIGNYFGIDNEAPNLGDGGNIIRDNFIGNTIGDGFIYNITYDTSGGGYNNNQIGWGCNTNTIGDGFNYNRIGDLFQENLLGVYFAGNEIGYFFNLNQINDNAGFNRIGEVSWFNVIGTGFESNRTGVSFFGNTIGNDFVHNTIGNYFGQFFLAGNTWGDNIYDNKFGDHTYGNDVLSNFNNNNIFNNFIGNTVGDDFQYNIIDAEVNGYDFTSNPATHVYSTYNCTIFTNSVTNLRLSYYDALDNLIITDPDL